MNIASANACMPIMILSCNATSIARRYHALAILCMVAPVTNGRVSFMRTIATRVDVSYVDKCSVRFGGHGPDGGGVIDADG